MQRADKKGASKSAIVIAEELRGQLKKQMIKCLIVKTSKMKKLILLALLMSSLTVFSQTTYNSSVTTKYKTEGEVFQKQRTITVSDTVITITNFLGGTKPLNLKVNEIKEKKDDFDGLMKRYYYCTAREKDVINGYTEYIIVMKKSYPSNMEINQKVDEVTFIKTVLSLR